MRYIFTPLKEGRYKDFLNKVRPWLASHDYYENYITTREAWFTRGMVAGVSITVFLALNIFLVREFGAAIAQHTFTWKTPLYMLGHWGQLAPHYFFIGSTFGAMLGAVEPPGVAYDKENPAATNDDFPKQKIG